LIGTVVKPEGSAYTIFNNALELPDPAARARYVNEACAGDAALFERVEKLLLAHDEAGGFFSQPLNPTAPVQSTAATASLRMEKAGDIIGRYKLLEQIGEGGCGVVYMAEQQEPVRRRVALKVIKLGMDTKQVVARFEAERQALALMEHPNIAKVLDAGATDTGRPYFVMELVRGIKITEFCDQKKLSTQERLELFIAVCRAVQHAHQKGVIHRDLKPSNILVTIVDGAPVPKVIDFGIAKATSNQPLTDKTLFTAFAQFVGTPAYMSPEQAEMSGVDIDTRTDIYSLGVVLYELLTGKTSFNAETLLRAGLDEIRRTIREHQPPKPSTRLHILSRADLTTTAQARHADGHRLIQAVKGDLDWIVMKCLEKERGRRYETVNGLAADILRHLNTEPVVARPPSRWYEFQKTVRRHKIEFAATGAVILALAIGLTMSLWTLVKEKHASERAVAAEREKEQQLYTALLEQARATIRSGEMGQRVRALDALRRAAAISNAVELRREAFAALALPDLRFERDLATHTVAGAAQLDPMFERIAVGRGRAPVEIRSASDDTLIVSLPASTNFPANNVKWSPDGRFIAAKRDHEPSGHRATLEVWEVGKLGEDTDTKPILVLHDLRWTALSFHSRLPLIVAGREGGYASIWDLDQRREVGHFTTPKVSLHLKFSPDGNRFAALGHSGAGSVISIHDATNGSLIASQKIAAEVMVLNWHPGGHWLGAVDVSGGVQLIDPATGETRVLGEHKAQAVTAEFSPSGQYLVTGGWERELIWWDLRTMKRAFTMALDAFHLHFDRDGRRCAVVTRDGTVKLHLLERPISRELAEALGTRLRQATFSPDGHWLAASADKRGGVWDLSNDGPPALDDDAREARFFFTPDGRELFSSRSSYRDDSGLYRWRLAPATNVATAPQLIRLPLRRPEGFTFLTLFSNSVVMTAAKGSQVLALDQIESDADRWVATSSGISGVSRDGRWLAIFRPFSSSLYVYEIPGLGRVAKLAARENILDFDFSPSGNELAIASRTRVEFWSTSDWKRTRVVTNFMNFMGALYAPDGRGIWVTKDSLTAGLYDARTLEPLVLLPIGTLPMAVSADGRQLAVSVDARRLQVWNLDEVRARFRELGLDWESTQAPALTASRNSTPRR
jgi:serine/threonine protein kinase/WD40 repeat protein